MMELRQRLVPQATGVVLEVGMGSGLNLRYYQADKVELVYGLEPSNGMRHGLWGMFILGLLGRGEFTAGFKMD